MTLLRMACTWLATSTLLLGPVWAKPEVFDGLDSKRPAGVPTKDLGVVPELLNDRSILLQDFGPTIAGSSLVGREVVDKFNEPVGKVIDLIIDPRTAELPLVLVDAIVRPANPGPRIVPQDLGTAPAKTQEKPKLKKTRDNRRTMAFPAASLALQADKQGRLLLVGDRADAAPLSVTDLKQPLTRKWLIERSLERKDLESWQEAVHVPPREDLREVSHPLHNYQLLRFTQLQGEKVNGEKDQLLGQLTDVAITTEHRRVPYAAITLAGDADKQLYQVPLLAFVVTEGKPWLIELPAALVKNSPKIDSAHWPSKVGRGWHEYVSERYNTNPRDGVELRKATPPSRSKP